MQQVRICGMQLKEKIVVLNTHTRKKKGQKGRKKETKGEKEKEKEPQINDWSIHLKKPENKYQTKPRASTKQEIKKIRAERHEIEYRKTRKKFNEKCQWYI